MFRKIIMLIMMWAVLGSGLMGSAQSASDDGSVVYPIGISEPTPNFVYCRTETWTLWCSPWNYEYTQVRCNVTHRCFFSRGGYHVYFYSRTCEYYVRDCCYSWPSGDLIGCTYWRGPYYRTETQELGRVFLGNCGCTSPDDCPSPPAL